VGKLADMVHRLVDSEEDAVQEEGMAINEAGELEEWVGSKPTKALLAGIEALLEAHDSAKPGSHEDMLLNLGVRNGIREVRDGLILYPARRAQEILRDA
jgi:hypothetical protein